MPKAAIEIENINHPGKRSTADRAMYGEIRRAVLAVLPANPPGMTVAELSKAILPLLDRDLFPGGAKAGWWTKAVQLDLEAKRLIVRSRSTPLRLRKVS
jgi:hypothetical protein